MSGAGDGLDEALARVRHLAAFADQQVGGNPAGVLVSETMPSEALMQALAAAVGHSETAFVVPEGEQWRVRYFAPVGEVPFCGHATLAIGAVLAQSEDDGVFPLVLNDARISVEGRRRGTLFEAALQSPPTRSASLRAAQVEGLRALFGLAEDDLDPTLPAARIHAGADHLLLGLSTRRALSAMRYDLDAGRDFMAREAVVTVMLVVAEGPQRFHARNAFASGGVYEDPATGAAAAAFAGCLRDLGWPHGDGIEIVQGEDMGMRSLLRAQIPPQKGSSIRVEGTVRTL